MFGWPLSMRLSRCQKSSRGIVAGNGGMQRILDQLPRAIAMEVLLRTGSTPPPLNGGVRQQSCPAGTIAKNGVDIRTKDQCCATPLFRLQKSWRREAAEMKHGGQFRMELFVNRMLQATGDFKGRLGGAQKSAMRFTST